VRIYQLEVSLLDNDVCKTHFRHYRVGMMCAGRYNWTVDADPCSGDIGSPMINGRVLVGIVAYPIGCGCSHIPSVYTDVYSNINWIRTTAFSLASTLRPAPFMVFILIILAQVSWNGHRTLNYLLNIFKNSRNVKNL